MENFQGVTEVNNVMARVLKERIKPTYFSESFACDLNDLTQLSSDDLQNISTIFTVLHYCSLEITTAICFTESVAERTRDAGRFSENRF